ncbi:MAG TPA: hypothetical protein VFU36_12395, partial [Jatrophihabitans sp.]|nr:hypothetical protein [Jatrophihabitans sp.]
FGRVVSNQRLKDDFGYLPSYDTSAAFDTLLTGRPVSKLISPELVAAAEERLAGLLRVPPVRPAGGPHPPRPTHREARHG